MTPSVLLVDDEPKVLSGYKRQLRKSFDIETAGSGQEALKTLVERGPFAVIVSDMRMPGMDGITLLREVRREAPDCVRMMLTGNADLQTCVDAVNEGSIFRFMTKPCEPEVLAAALEAGVEQYRLITSERELLHGTLAGCIRTLSDILSLMNPAAFSRATRIRRYVRHIAAELNAPHFWEYDMAAALSHIGCVALPPEVVSNMNAGRVLSNSQRNMIASHPAMGCQLLAEIPRLGVVAQIVAKQKHHDSRRIKPRPDMSEEDIVEFGAQLLHIALDLDHLLGQKKSFIEALSALHREYGPDHPMVEALMSFESTEKDKVVMETTARELSTSMFAAEDIMSAAGRVLLAKGEKITQPVILQLQNCAQMNGLREPFKVEVYAEA